jgi:hypothetical protein
MRPEQTLLALTLTDGSVAVMSFVTRGFNLDGSMQFEREVTDEAVRLECAKTALELASWRQISVTDLPSREYRDAWVDHGDRIGHDMPKARDLHRAKIRSERAPMLVELDVLYQRADELGDAAEKVSVARRKKLLRDAPSDPRIDQAETLDELKLVTLR